MRSAFQIRVFPSLCASVWLVATAISQPALADSDRKPVILDTQTGIHDGQSGVVLQSAPLGRTPIVSATDVAAPGELAPQTQPAIVVSPYIALPAGASAPLTELRPRPAPVQ
jgi:hypothetical protein